ncbi:MAG: HD domain-containing protein [Acidimicrobiales bacterium]
MSELGTLAWASRTGGVITDADREELNGRIGAVLEAAARPAPESALDATFESLAPPDSELCIEATALWSLVTPEWLEHHGYRTWYFARALAEIDNLSPDPELLYVACILHDLGLTKHAVPSNAVPCFAVNGGREAGLLTVSHRGSESADLVSEAITLHLNIDVPPDAGDLAYLVTAGTMIDVAGPRVQLLPTELLAAILVEHPRGPFGEKIAEVFQKCGVRYPDTRAGYMQNQLNIADLARAHPLDIVEGT